MFYQQALRSNIGYWFIFFEIMNKSLLLLGLMSFHLMQSDMKKHYVLIIIFIHLATLVSAQSQYTNLATMHISTVDSRAVADKTTWIPASISIVSTDTALQLSMSTVIRGRGNSTWGMAKKPYRIKLDKKTNLLNMPAKAKNWVLLANYADKTLIRNAVAFKIGETLGLEFTPSVSFVDLSLNGHFMGNYMVTDQVEVGPNRVAIDKQDSTDTSEPAITGGYLLEIDGFAYSEAVWFTTRKGLNITIKSPDDDDINQAQLDYIQNYIANFENTLFSDQFEDPIIGYRTMLDTTSLVNWYIACELTGNSDSFWSTYLYKKRWDNKLYFGPMWDYDIAFNNDDRLGDATQKLMRQHAFNPKTWIERLWLDEWFKKAVWRRWKEIKANNLSGILNSYINNTQMILEESAQLNFNKWDNLNMRVYREVFLFDSYNEGVEYLKTYMADRIDFLDIAFSYSEPIKPSEPFVVSDGYYMIVNKRTKNAIDVAENSLAESSKLVLWEPSEGDDAQLWEIKQLNDSLYRFTNRNSGLAMAGNGRATNLIQVPTNELDDSQKWKILPVSTGNVYGIVNQKSNFSINNSGGSFANGTSAIEYTNNIHNSENQQWFLQKMNLTTVGLTQNKLFAQAFDVYPNPANNHISIRFTVNSSQRLTFKVYDIAGNQKYSRITEKVATGNQLLVIPISDLLPGIYFINISNDQGESNTLKFIKNH